MTYSSQYGDAVLDEMQQLYGDGYLSPGGEREVDQLLEGLNVEGARVLDLGCGVGGAAMRMLTEFGAATVVGVEVEEYTLAHAREKVQAAELESRITLELIVPGPLPFDTSSFDLVFCKDVVCHLPDKLPLFAEVARVLKPGGCFALGDWSMGPTPVPGTDACQRRVQRPDGLILYFEPLDAYLCGMTDAGFDSVTRRDHSKFLLDRTRRELDVIVALQAEKEDSEAMSSRLAVTQRRLESLESGTLQHWHFQAIRASAEA